MATIINNATITDDTWLQLDAAEYQQIGESGLVPDFPEGPDLLVPLVLWRRRPGELLGRQGRFGILVDGADEPAGFADALPHASLVAIRIPVFTDGRAYSLARLIRERHGYTGELRAVGDVQRDQLFYLSRCGFDAFALKDPARSAEALAGLRDFSDAYQASVERPQPLFRRRAA